MKCVCRVALILSINVAFVGITPVWSKGKTVTTCSGVDMLTEMRVRAPHDYARLMAKSLRVKNGGAIFWRISKGDKPTSYLFGTMHLSDPRISKLPKAARTALKKAKVLALELEDLSQIAAARAISGAADLVVFKDGKKLSDLLSDKEFKLVQNKLSKLGIPVQMVPYFKPWIVSLLTAVSACERNRVKGGALVLDMTLAAQARKKGIPVVGLETLQSQLKAAASISLSEQLFSLRTSLAYSERADDMMETIVGMYLRRQIGAALPFQLYLAAKAGIPATSLKGLQQELIVKRNRKMRTRALPLLGKGGALIGVGALHLVGEDGLVALIRKAGYIVEPIE